MKRLNMLALLALVVFAGCGDDIDILIVDDDDQQSSDTTKAPIIYGVIIAPEKINLSLGPCASVKETNRFTATVLGFPQTVVWRSLNTSVADIDSTGTVMARGPGTTGVIATSTANPLKADTATVEVTGCLILERSRFISRFTPADTTITITDSYNLVGGQAIVPAGASRKLVIVSPSGCVAPTSQKVFSIKGDTIRFEVRMMGIALCRDSVSVKLEANLDEERFVWVTVNSAGQTADTSVVLVPRSGSGAPGTRLQTRCVVTAIPPVANSECSYYSTNPSVFLVMPENRTLLTQSGPWAPGIYYLGGLIHFLSPGVGQECAVLKVNPHYADCGTFFTSSPSGVEALFGQRRESRRWEVPEPLRYLIR